MQDCPSVSGEPWYGRVRKSRLYPARACAVDRHLCPFWREAGKYRVEGKRAGIAGTYGHELSAIIKIRWGIYELSRHQAMQRLPRNRCGNRLFLPKRVKRVKVRACVTVTQALLEIIG